jgi:hypothetical protein
VAGFEASHTDRSTADPAAIWELWAQPERWSDWNEQVVRAELDGELRVGAEAKVRLHRGGTVRFTVTELEPERLLVDEARFPGARLGHEHRLRPGTNSVEISHRLYVNGPLAGLWSLLIGRKRMREQVVRFVERERELTEPRTKKRRRRRK